MTSLTLIFRKPRSTAFSIENVFGQLVNQISKTFGTTEAHAPESKLTPANILNNLRFARQLKTDIYHITGDVHYLAMALPGNRTMLTIHDCVFVRDSAGLKRRLLKFFFLDWPVRHCKVITTISEKSKREIIELTGCNHAKIYVIPNPLNESCSFAKKEFNGTKPVILFLGTKVNKNLPRAIEACSGLNCTLDIVGKLTDQQLNLLERYNISYTNSFDLTNQEIVKKYQDADIVLFPSLYEGFGLPVIEANKSGRVIVTSNIEPMSEVAANAACLVDPLDAQSIRDGIKKVIHDEKYRNYLIFNGFQNVQRFSSKAIAQEYISLYNQLKLN